MHIIFSKMSKSYNERKTDLSFYTITYIVLNRFVNMNTNITSLGLSIDGGYYCKINDGLYKVGYRLNLEKLSRYIRDCIADKFGLDVSQCLITESHFFRGRFRMPDAKKKNRLEGDRAFEDTLIENDVVFHYKHIAEMENGSIKEKGIDVWFALETYELAVYRDFDFVVLITGDADHEMLARKIKALKKQVVLVTWNMAEKDSTSPALKEEVTMHIDLDEIAKEDASLLGKICDSIQ